MIGPLQGVISSPGYPGNYPNNRDCIWIVGVPPGNTIMFTFGHIQLEPHPNCTMAYDFVEVGWNTVDLPLFVCINTFATC